MIDVTYVLEVAGIAGYYCGCVKASQNERLNKLYLKAVNSLARISS